MQPQGIALLLCHEVSNQSVGACTTKAAVTAIGNDEIGFGAKTTAPSACITLDTTPITNRPDTRHGSHLTVRPDVRLPAIRNTSTTAAQRRRMRSATKATAISAR